MSQPLRLDRFIQLTTAAPLDAPTRRCWYATVRAQGPSGVVTTVASVDDTGVPSPVALVQRETAAGYAYLIPLTRDLADSEVARIVQAFAAAQPDLDFDVETQVRGTAAAAETPGIRLDHAAHLELCTALSKQKHEDWMRERSDAGWRYGPSFSAQAKTHPLLRPWHELPDRFRVPDLTWPDTLLKVLDQHGYRVLHKDDAAADPGA